MFEAIEADGILTVTEMEDCAYYATYDNYLMPGPGFQEYTLETGAIVRVFKGGGDLPEELQVEAWGVIYSVMIDDWTKGELCVPWPVIG